MKKYAGLVTQEVIADAKSGSQEAVAFIMGFYKSKVSSIARHYYIQGADSDDLLQEAMIALYKAVMSYDSQRNDNFDAFLTLCVKRHLSSVVKNSNCKKHIPLNTYVSIDSEGAPVSGLTAPDIAKTVIDREELAKISAIYTTQLSGYEQKVLSLSSQGYSYREIAAAMCTSVKSVDNAVCRIRKKIKSDL